MLFNTANFTNAQSSQTFKKIKVLYIVVITWSVRFGLMCFLSYDIIATRSYGGMSSEEQHRTKSQLNDYKKSWYSYT